MLETFAIGLAKVIVAPLVIILSIAGFNFDKAPKVSVAAPVAQEQSLGGFNPSGGGTYRLGTSIGTTNTSIRLSSFKEPVSNISYTMSYLNTDVAYGTLSPQSNGSEFISFTGITQNGDGSATLTGVTRGLSRSYPYTASSTLRQSHPGQSIFILSDSPGLFNEYVTKRNDETITGLKTFTYSPILNDANSTSTSQAASRQFVLNTAIQGAATSTESNMGIVQLPTLANVQAGTASSTTGAPLIIPLKYATTTPQSSQGYIIQTDSTGKIPAHAIATTSNYIWSGIHTFSQTSGTTTFSGNALFSASTTMATTSVSDLRVNGLYYGNKLSTFTSDVTFGPSSTATSTLMSFTLPANALATSSAVVLRVNISNARFFTGNFRVALNYGGVSAAYFTAAIGADTDSQLGYIEAILQNAGTVSTQEGMVRLNTTATQINTTAVPSAYATGFGTGVVNSAIDQTVSLTASFSASSANHSVTVANGVAEIIK